MFARPVGFTLKSDSARKLLRNSGTLKVVTFGEFHQGRVANPPAWLFATAVTLSSRPHTTSVDAQ
ncbi:MAG: hypothetical protein JWM55_1693 [Acidimicrobiaceae bacterium]|nr:hypothetical protein [Acidimicrobiaceae bacterium]